MAHDCTESFLVLFIFPVSAIRLIGKKKINPNELISEINCQLSDGLNELFKIILLKLIMHIPVFCNGNIFLPCWVVISQIYMLDFYVYECEYFNLQFKWTILMNALLKSNLYKLSMISNPFVSCQYLRYKIHIKIQIFIWNRFIWNRFFFFFLLFFFCLGHIFLFSVSFIYYEHI